MLHQYKQLRLDQGPRLKTNTTGAIVTLQQAVLVLCLHRGGLVSDENGRRSPDHSVQGFWDQPVWIMDGPATFTDEGPPASGPDNNPACQGW